MPPLNDIVWPQGKPNMGGLRDAAYFVPVDDVDFTTPPTLGTNNKVITGDIILKATKKWFTFYFTKGTGKIDYTVVGERDGKSFENMAEFNVPGGDAANQAVIDEILNTPGLLIGKDSSGNQLILGISKNEDNSLNLDLPVYLENAAGTTGAASADKRGVTITMKSEAPHSPLHYTGSIDVDDAT
ncbi:MAG: hypothetical protein AAF363_18730 [Bacteroidota bacterium]